MKKKVRVHFFYLWLVLVCASAVIAKELRLETPAPGRHIVISGGYQLRLQPSGHFDVYVSRRRLIIGPAVHMRWQGRRYRASNLVTNWVSDVEMLTDGIRIEYSGAGGDLAVRRVFKVKAGEVMFEWDAEVINPSPATRAVFVSGGFRDCENVAFKASRRYARPITGRFSETSPEVTDLKSLWFYFEDRAVEVRWLQGVHVGIGVPRYLGDEQRIFHLNYGDFYPAGVLPNATLMPGDRLGFSMLMRVVMENGKRK